MKRSTRKARSLARNLAPLSLRPIADNQLVKVCGGRQTASTSTSACGADDTMVDESPRGGNIEYTWKIEEGES